jgi:hypothetical protein
MRISDHGREVIVGILTGARSHKDLKSAFDWEDTLEGFAFWSAERNGDCLSEVAVRKLCSAVGFRPVVFND